MASTGFVNRDAILIGMPFSLQYCPRGRRRWRVRRVARAQATDAADDAQCHTALARHVNLKQGRIGGRSGCIEFKGS